MKDLVLEQELSAELFKRGIITDVVNWWIFECGSWVVYKKNTLIGTYNENYPAPTCEELLELLPKSVCDKQWVLTKAKTDNDHYIYYPSLIHIQYKKLTTALAKMLIWLDDNNYLEKK